MGRDIGQSGGDIAHFDDGRRHLGDDGRGRLDRDLLLRLGQPQLGALQDGDRRGRGVNGRYFARTLLYYQVFDQGGRLHRLDLGHDTFA